MTNKHDDYDVPSLVPERDELVSHRPAQRGSRAERAEQEGNRAGTSGAVRFLLALLVIGLLASAGAGYFFYTQGQSALQDLRSAEERLANLESRLSAVGENSEETMLNLVERIETNFSEIDKLWAARNSNRTSIAENAEAVASQGEVVASLETAMGRQADILNRSSTALTELQGRVDSMAANLDGIENVSGQLSSLNQELEQLRSSMQTLERDLKNRLNITEQDIESINVYRLQLNQTVSAIQSAIHDLQERLGR